MGNRVLPFTTLDEILHHVDLEAEPPTVHLELVVSGGLDPTKLRTAVHAAIGRHPLAQVRKIADRRRLRPPLWEVTEELGAEPFKSVDGEVSVHCSALYSQQIRCDVSPTVRVLHVRGDHADRVLLSVNHTAADGIGTLRLAQSIARAYAGDEDPPAPVDPIAVRDLAATLGRRSPRSLPQRLAAAARMLRPKTTLTATADETQPGYGFTLVGLDPDESAALKSRKDVGATANDVLVAAAHMAIGRTFGQRQPDRVTVTIPVNLRPADWREEVFGNFTTQLITDSGTERLDPEATLACVVAQTRAAKQAGTAWDLFEKAYLVRALPLALPLFGAASGDTVVLSNLGHLNEPFRFGPGLIADEVWFSPPCNMPMGVGIGVGGGGPTEAPRTLLTFRHCRALYDNAAAETFTRYFRSALADLRCRTVPHQ